MAFRDELVRCAACGNQFVYTVREQRRRKARGLPTEAPVFCEDCRGSDVRLANAEFEDDPALEGAEQVAVEARGSHGARPAGRADSRATSDEAGVATADGQEGRRRSRTANRKEAQSRAGGSRPSGRSRGERGERGRSRKRRSEPPRQTELRVRYMGTVKWFDEDRGFGFIAQEDGEELFVHSKSVLVDGRPALVQGQEVEYEIARTSRGPQAVDVVPVS